MKGFFVLSSGSQYQLEAPIRCVPVAAEYIDQTTAPKTPTKQRLTPETLRWRLSAWAHLTDYYKHKHQHKSQVLNLLYTANLCSLAGQNKRIYCIGIKWKWFCILTYTRVLFSHHGTMLFSHYDDGIAVFIFTDHTSNSDYYYLHMWYFFYFMGYKNTFFSDTLGF